MKETVQKQNALIAQIKRSHSTEIHYMTSHVEEIEKKLCSNLQADVYSDMEVSGAYVNVLREIVGS
jgi:hypothetical protein